MKEGGLGKSLNNQPALTTHAVCKLAHAQFSPLSGCLCVSYPACARLLLFVFVPAVQHPGVSPRFVSLLTKA